MPQFVKEGEEPISEYNITLIKPCIEGALEEGDNKNRKMLMQAIDGECIFFCIEDENDDGDNSVSFILEKEDLKKLINLIDYITE